MLCFSERLSLLVLARALQGLSGSVVYTAGLALVADAVSPNEIGSWYVCALVA